jgi:hypothetical protein
MRADERTARLEHPPGQTSQKTEQTTVQRIPVRLMISETASRQPSDLVLWVVLGGSEA